MQKHAIRLKHGDVSRLAVKRVDNGVIIEVYDSNDDEILVQAKLSREELDNLEKAIGYVKFNQVREDNN